jgi:pimeloyl-ACP methyl ester carboxylesterase
LYIAGVSAIPGDAPFDLAAPWGGRSHVTDLDGPVHWVEFSPPEGTPVQGDASGTPVVLVHGLGGSHLNWVHVGPALAAARRVVALDLPGFGLTPAGSRSTSVHANAEVLGRFLDEVVGAPAVLVGNSMGGMVSLLLAGRSPERVAGLVLVDPALPNPRQRQDPQVAMTFALYAVPRVGELFLSRMQSRFTDRQRVLGTVRLCFADATRADDAVVDAGVTLTQWRGSLPARDTEFLGAARSLLGVLRRPRRYDALLSGIDRPVLLVHGDRDRLVPLAAARRAATRNPGWATVWLEDVGHTPQLEVPERFVAEVEPWLEGVDALRADDALQSNDGVRRPTAGPA